MRVILYREVLKELFQILIFFIIFTSLPFLSLAQEVDLGRSALHASNVNNLLTDIEIPEKIQEKVLEDGSISEARQALLKHVVGLPITGGEGIEVIIETGERFSAFSLEKTGENMVELGGNVILSLKERGSYRSHRIQAHRIVWAEDRKTLWAEGSVGYVLSDKGKISSFQCSSLFLSIPESQVFLNQLLGQTPWSVNGESVQISFGGKSLSGIIVESEQIQVQVMEQGFITTSHVPSPYYRLQAEKIWFLGNDEWAVYNAILYLGEVPIFYFPFYLHSHRKFLFYPQVGFDPYRGAFLMTTTYLIGQQTGIANAFVFDPSRSFFFFTNQSRKKIRGLWWENMNETLINSDYLKLIVDGYFNLGLYAAVDFYFSREKAFYRGHFGLAISRTLYSHSGNFFYPFPEDSSQSYNLWGLFVPNKTYFFGLEIPLRWSFLYEQGQEMGNWEFKIQAEHHSDSYVYRDFLSQRTESLNPWLGFALTPYSDYLLKPSKFDNFYISTGYLWGFYNPLVTQFSQNFTLKYEREGWYPFWIMYFKWEVMQAGLLWGSRSNKSYSIYDPRSTWFYLREINFPQTQVDIRGSLYEWSSKEVQDDIGFRENNESGKKEGFQEVEEKEESDLLKPSPLGEENIIFRRPNRDSYFSLYYSYNPHLGFKTFWEGSDWKKPEDVQMNKPDYITFNWNNYLRLNGIGYFQGQFLVLRMSTIINSHWLSEFWESKRYCLSKGSKRDDVLISQSITIESYFAQDYLLFHNSYIRQVINFDIFSYSQTDFRGNILREWNYFSKKNSFTKNEMEVYIEFSNENIGGSHNFKFNVPNENWLLTTNFRAWFNFHPFKGESFWGSELSKTNGWKPYLWKNYLIYNPVSDIFVRTGLSYSPILNQLYSVDIFFKVNFFEFGFWYKQITPLSFDKTLLNWKIASGFQGGKTQFRPYKLRLAFVGDIVKTSFLRGQGFFFLNLDTGYETLLERFTEGEFWFQWRAGLRLNNFMEFSISSASNNTQFFRYFPSFVSRLGLPRAKLSFWKDLGDSLTFWDSEVLSRSNFKWKSFQLKFRQIFYDWYWDTTWIATPIRSEYKGEQKLDFRHTFSISVRWTPMNSIRAYIEKGSTDDGYKTGIGDSSIIGSTFDYR